MSKFETVLNDIKEIDNVLNGDDFSLVLNIGCLFYHIVNKDVDLTKLNEVLERYEHPTLFGELPPSTNALHIELIDYITRDLIESVETPEQAKVAFSYYEKFKMVIFQSDKGEMQKFEKELSLISEMNDARKLFLQAAKFELKNISLKSKKYYIANI
jgi:hypothetical protein